MTDDDAEDADRYAHLTGDYYIDRQAYSPWVWIAGGVLIFLLPPVGGAILGWCAIGSLTTTPDDDGEEDPDT